MAWTYQTLAESSQIVVDHFGNGVVYFFFPEGIVTGHFGRTRRVGAKYKTFYFGYQRTNQFVFFAKFSQIVASLFLDIFKKFLVKSKFKKNSVLEDFDDYFTLKKRKYNLYILCTVTMNRLVRVLLFEKSWLSRSHSKKPEILLSSF